MDISLSELSEVKGIGKKTIQRIREYKLADEGYISEYNESLHLNRNSVNQGDCLELMNGIPDKSVDMILADLPYGTTSCNWDSIIPLDKLWLQYERIIKDNGAIVLTASQPFTTKLIDSNKGLFRYCWVWDKVVPGNGLLANKRPMKQHEDICVFYKKPPTYNKQMTEPTSDNFDNKVGKNSDFGEVYSKTKSKRENFKRKNPVSILRYNKFSQECNSHNRIHNTQKPVGLFEYLIKTYTNKGDLVLDNVAGSGTTGVACQNTNRDYILIEKEQKYIDVIKERLES